jgi:predicted phosphodiesterase
VKLAIISDIHANLDALTVCLDWIQKNNIDKTICLGDLVDYCAQPNECIELVKKHCDNIILGNHDEAQFHLSMANGFTENAKITSIHTRSVINKDYVDWFETLPMNLSVENLLFVHASPCHPKEYEYILDSRDARENFGAFEEEVCFIGHSHLPVIFCKQGEEVIKVSESEVKRGSRYIINVGSVGQPRDKNPN